MAAMKAMKAAKAPEMKAMKAAKAKKAMKNKTKGPKVCYCRRCNSCELWFWQTQHPRIAGHTVDPTKPSVLQNAVCPEFAVH